MHRDRELTAAQGSWTSGRRSTMTQQGGRDSDGAGTTGIVEEKTREAQPGETDTTRFGMVEEGDDSDGKGTGGMVDGEDAGGPRPDTGAATGLQRGGTTPGGGPGTGEGALGTGGGSTADDDTGTLERWSDGELEEGRR
jgi:hypothetical protein